MYSRREASRRVRAICTYSLGTALRGRESPASEAISHISGVARSATEAVVEVAVVRGAAVVKTGSTVEFAAAVVTSCTLGLGQSLLETIARGGPAGAVTDHLGDLAGRAGVLARAAARAIVRLHEAGVADAVVGGGHADAALALLHHDGEDEAAIYTRLAGDLVDGALDVADLVVRVVGAPAVPAARLLHERDVGGPELVKGAPGALCRPATGGRAVALVKGVRVAVPGDESGRSRRDSYCEGSDSDA